MKRQLYLRVRALLLSLTLGCADLFFATSYATTSPVTPISNTVPIVSTNASLLNDLTNDAILEQLQNTYDDLQNRLRIKMRMVAEREILLEKAQNSVQEFSLPLPANSRWLSAAEQDKNQLEYSKTLVIALKKRLKLREEEKTFLDQYAKELTAAQTEIDNALPSTNKLDALVLQINLRVNDRSLSTQLVRKLPNFTQVQRLRQSLSKQQTQLSEKAQSLKSTIETVVKILEDTKKSLLKAEAAQQTEQEKYAQIQKRQELAQSYSKKSPQLLRTELADLQYERGWLQSTFEVSTRNFIAKREVEESLSKTLEEMTAPETKTTAAIEDAEAEQNLKNLADYHEKHLVALEGYRHALNDTVRAGEILQGDASVLNDHLIKMQAIAEVLEYLVTNDNNAQKEIVPETRSSALKTINAQISSKLSEASAAVEHAQQQLFKLKETETASKESVEQARKSMINVQRERNFALETRKWVSELQALAADELAARFHTTTENLEKTIKLLEQQRDEFTKTNTEYNDAIRKLTSLQDPLARQIQEQKQNEQIAIAEQLYQFAGLELPKKEVAAPPPANKCSHTPGKGRHSRAGKTSRP
ncbi:exported hypothetical protein [Gammaproteobacteria bacterium]